MDWSFWLDLLVRSTIVICAGESLRRSWKRYHAAQRHRILVFVFALLTVLPLFSILLPAFRIPLWPSSELRGIVTIQTTTAFTAGQNPRLANSAGLVNWFFVVWVCGALATLFFLAVGRFLLLRTVRRASPLSEKRWAILLRESCSTLGLDKTPDLMVLRNLTMPFVFGSRRPRILLPGGLRRMDRFA